MKAITKRNMLIYFKNRTNILFSLMGSLIVFVLYLVFIRQNMLKQVENLSNGSILMDMWMTGALLTVTAWTTSFSTLGQLIKDKTSNKFMDFKMTETSSYKLILGYFLVQLSSLFLCS